MLSKRVSFLIPPLLMAANFIGCATHLVREQEEKKRFIPYSNQNYLQPQNKGMTTSSRSQTLSLSNAVASNAPSSGSLGHSLNPAVPVASSSSNGILASGPFYPVSYWSPRYAGGSGSRGGSAMSGELASNKLEPAQVRNLALPRSAGFVGGGDVMCRPARARSVTEKPQLTQLTETTDEKCPTEDAQMAEILNKRYGTQTGSAFLAYLQAQAKKNELCPSTVLATFTESLCDQESADGMSCVLPRMGEINLVEDGLLRLCSKDEDASVLNRSLEELKKSPPCISNPVIKLDTWLRARTPQKDKV